jgi:hypothetical protein
MTSLSALLAAAVAFEAGTLKSGDAFWQLLEGSSRAGGARPKALVHDEEGEWLAKFPSTTRDGELDVVGLEGACLILAAAAGLRVPVSRLQPVGRRRVLLVRRFDVTPQGGRVHGHTTACGFDSGGLSHQAAAWRANATAAVPNRRFLGII